MKHPRGKRYDPEFKLRLAKEFAETDKTLEEIAQENGISSKTLNNWTVKYRKEGEAAFFKDHEGEVSLEIQIRFHLFYTRNWDLTR